MFAGEPHLLADPVVRGEGTTAIRQCFVLLGSSQECCSGGPPDPTTVSQVVLDRRDPSSPSEIERRGG